jgi:hypothetical protein
MSQVTVLDVWVENAVESSQSAADKNVSGMDAISASVIRDSCEVTIKYIVIRSNCYSYPSLHPALPAYGDVTTEQSHMHIIARTF